MKYQVIVGNVGTIVDTDNGFNAIVEYNRAVTRSKTGAGRGYREEVTLMRDGEPVREYRAPTVWLYRLGDGNEGNYPRFNVILEHGQSPYAAIAALVANRYISGSRTRRYIVKNTDVDGEAEYSICASVYEGPKGEQAFGAAWITAELCPESRDNLPEYSLADMLDRSAMRQFNRLNRP